MPSYFSCRILDIIATTNAFAKMIDKVLMGIGGQGTDRHSSASIAQFLAANGADLNMKNKEGHTPLDLCPDPNLCKALVKASNELVHTKSIDETETKTNNNNSAAGDVPTTSATDVRLDDKNNTSSAENNNRLDRNECNNVGDKFDNNMTLRSMGTVAISQTNLPKRDNHPMNNTVVASSSPRCDTPSTSSSSTTATVSNNEDLVERQNNNNALDVNDDDENECLVCSDRPRDTILQPCNHMVACASCSSRLKKCLECKETIISRIKLKECAVCSDKPATVMFRPCNHVCACQSCAKLMKKCIECREPIESKSPLLSTTLRSPALRTQQLKAMTQNSLTTTNINEKPSTSTSNNNTNHKNMANNLSKDSRNSEAEIKKLQQQLQDIKEQVMCPVCLDRIKNMIFLCGHGACQLCGDRMTECPICRKPVEKRIILY